jgi:hypothetical protein
MTSPLKPILMPAQRVGLLALFAWPAAWAMVFLLVAIAFVWALQIGLTIGGVARQAGCVGALLALCAVFRRRNRSIADMAEGWALWFAFTPAVAVLSYLAASCAFPLQDALLEQADRFIGFDWSAWHKLVVDRPAVRWPLLLAYISLLPQTFFAIIYFPATEKSARVGELFLLAGATGIVTVLISALMPALGPFATYAAAGDEVGYLRDVLALRANGPWHFEMSAMEGIITMPSYHTVMALLIAHAFRRTGLVGYGIATLNVAMLLSIPSIGGHYLVDVLAGGALAFAAIGLQRSARRLFRC